MIALTLEIAPETVQVERLASGALHLPGLALHASVSSVDRFSALALARRPVGVDVEAAAADHLDALKLWTARESYAKALGEGWRRFDPEAISVSKSNKGFVASAPDMRGGQGQWRMTDGLIISTTLVIDEDREPKGLSRLT